VTGVLDDPTRIRVAGFHGRFWPHPEAELLLRAALFPDDRGRQAWETLRPRFDLDRVGGAPFHILPLLSRNLTRLGVDDPILGRLRGLHRISWYRNQLRLRDLRHVIDRLAGAGIQTIVLKGAAFVLLYYRDIGARFMGDVDVLVRTADRDRALRLLQREGWRVPAPYANQVSTNLFRDDGSQLDLHWHLLAELLVPGDPHGASNDLWDAAPEMDLVGARTRTLCAADHLLHVLVQGSLQSESAHLRWIADATTILDVGGDEIDWNRFLNQTRRRRAEICARETLQYLRARFDAPVPEHVTRHLQRAQTGPWQTLLYVARTDPEPIRRIAVVLQWYLEAEAPRGSILSAITGFPRFVLRTWGLAHLWQIPAEALRRARRRYRGRHATR
jgi:hypothetical protein